MIATITVSRRDNRGEDREFLVDLTRDRDGDIYATCGEDLDELRTTNRHGSIETHPTGRLFQRRGDPIELTDEELEEAETALTQLETIWQTERARLKQIFAPIANEEFPGLAKGNCYPESDHLGRTEATERSEIACRRQSEGRGEAEANAEIGRAERGAQPGLSWPPNASPRGPSNSSSTIQPSDFAPPSENKSGSGMLKTTQARSNTSSSEASQNLKSPPDPVNPGNAPHRHDLLNSQGQNITLPPGAPAASVSNNPPTRERIIPSETLPTGPLPHSEFRVPRSELVSIPSSALAPLPATPAPKDHAAHE